MGLWGFKNGPEIGTGRFRVKLNWGFVLMAVALLGFVIILVGGDSC